MTFKRGSVYLANFNPSKGSEPGKIRPCLVIQSDDLNETSHQTVTVMPLTTRLLDDALPMRVTVEARDNLWRTSQVMIDQIRAFDVRRFTSETLTVLTKAEMSQVEESLRVLLSLEN